MWSIGCITIVLLGGAILPDTWSDHDLDMLDDDNDDIWNKVGHHPKDFIRNLYVLEDRFRMTATEALNHSWFSNKNDALAFDELYNRSIRNWRPRPKVFQLVEKLPDYLAKLTANPAERHFSQEVVSRFFTQPQQSHDTTESSSYSRSMQQKAIDNPMDQFTPSLEPKGGYPTNEDDTRIENSECYGSTESMNDIWDELRQEIISRESDVRPSTPEAQPQSDIVYETPV